MKLQGLFQEALGLCSPWEVTAKVISQQGTCAAGHKKPGDEFLIREKVLEGATAITFQLHPLP